MKTIIGIAITSLYLSANAEPANQNHLRAIDDDLSWLNGTWTSEEVHLVRGALDETYQFQLKVKKLPGDVFSTSMNINYTQNTVANSKRGLEQDIIISLKPTKEILFSGKNVRQKSEPKIVGIYAPDDFLCERPHANSANKLLCVWGSEANPTSLRVTFTRQ